MPVGAILGVGSALIGAGSARSAQRSQERAAADQLGLQERMYDETVARFAPYADVGIDYNNALRYELLGGDRPTSGGNALQVLPEEYEIPGTMRDVTPRVHDRMTDRERNLATAAARQPQMGTRYRVGDQTFADRSAADAYARANATGGGEYQGFQATPGYQFARNQGISAIDNSAASSGSLHSGATMRRQMEYGTGLANQEYNNYLNRLTGGAASGQAAAGNQANAGANFAAGGSAAIGARGDAQAAGAIGVGNALNQGIGNIYGMWNYQNQLGAGTASLPGGSQASIW